MIGFWGMLVYFVALLAFGLFSLAAVNQYRRRRGVGPLLLMSLMVLTFLLMLYRGIDKSVYLYRLHHLNSEAVESVQIDSQSPISADGRASILHALNHAQWFEASHSGWSRSVPLKIRMKDGRSYTYSVALYKYGAVILTNRENAFSKSLPSALLQNGIVLPR